MTFTLTIWGLSVMATHYMLLGMAIGFILGVITWKR